jgi:hypothetical protein
LNVTTPTAEWILDSRATKHFTGVCQDFTDGLKR